MCKFRPFISRTKISKKFPKKITKKNIEAENSVTKKLKPKYLKKRRKIKKMRKNAKKMRKNFEKN